MANLGNRLDTGDRLPPMRWSLPDGGGLSLPDDLGDGWAVVLIYRGQWCGFCRGQLADFAGSQQQMRDEGIAVTAGSVDGPDKARQAASEAGASFPVAHGLDAEAISRAVGAFYEPDKKYLQPAGFLLRPDRTIAVACYSTGPIGRFAAADVIKLTKVFKKQD